jgi:predicted secreted protein
MRLTGIAWHEVLAAVLPMGTKTALNESAAYPGLVALRLVH